jgi:tRNA A-37 threonylcarbamoyl transferase component Bud32
MLKTHVIPPAGPPAYLQPGEIVAERYRLERELGRGSMGVVWSAIHVTLGQRVAIKLISAGQIDSPETRHRFSTEAKAAARLKSRHAVQVYDDGETLDGTPYIVMEYLEGETLEAKLERGALALPEAVRITSHVCRALSRAHAQGIIHRDLKPANIFIARAEEDEHGWLAKVLDFGVAKLTSSTDPSHTKTGTLVGTPLFMSPEQVRGASHVDRRADLYSLGMVFFNMITGHFAFEAPSYSDVLVKICLGPLPDLSGVSGIPEAVRAWFDKACAREASERFQSADEMSEALRDAAGNLRQERTSMPEEVLGPSGTVMGYGGPDLLDFSASPARQLAAAGVHGPYGTLKSEPLADQPALNSPGLPLVTPSQPSFDPLLAAEPLAVEGVPKRSNWPLWLAAGAGLGLAMAGGGTLLFLVRVSEPPRAPPESAATARPSAREVPPPAPTNLAPIPLPTAVTPPLSSPAAVSPGSSASVQTEVPAPKVARPTAKRPSSVVPRIVDPIPASRPPPAKGGAPDIGF